ncbi:hypothetical protein AGDE_15783 [Angomonas deanei]|uniref:Galactose oxidase, central domain containing protein n=1 Tax=Angomonas deanei TaxID=59799 RepID=A0A7G2C9N0_9TRYP|nr:hypothetical protein AGDE_15783 [Angomonas deanei]CAD2216165.1 hypothetical protein, conserved [Angomonas deanei]|eukprot:EPY18471.1 hypothetical protein AGDE_15783 [Angomonas deanei]
MKRLPHLLREFHAHLAHESTTAYTRENSVSGEEEDGYISEASDFLGGEENPAGSSTDEESDGSGEEEEETIHVVPVTAERLQQLQSEFHDNHPSANRAVSESAYTSVTAHTNRPMPSVGVASQYSYRPPPTAQPTQEREDMDSNSVLQWKPVLPPIAPKTRHGHALVYCYPNLYLFGGCYWAHGDAMSTTDLYYNVYDQRWRQCKEEVVPPRFMASVAVSNASHTFPQHTDHTVSENDPNRAHMVLYAFGGLDFNRQLSNHLYRTQLPPSRYELLPQLGHHPPTAVQGCAGVRCAAGDRGWGGLSVLHGWIPGRQAHDPVHAAVHAADRDVAAAGDEPGLGAKSAVLSGVHSSGASGRGANHTAESV